MDIRCRIEKEHFHGIDLPLKQQPLKVMKVEFWLQMTQGFPFAWSEDIVDDYVSQRTHIYIYIILMFCCANRQLSVEGWVLDTVMFLQVLICCR
jgi:hypothetical protein